MLLKLKISGMSVTTKVSMAPESQSKISLMLIELLNKTDILLDALSTKENKPSIYLSDIFFIFNDIEMDPSNFSPFL